MELNKKALKKSFAVACLSLGTLGYSAVVKSALSKQEISMNEVILACGSTAVIGVGYAKYKDADKKNPPL